MKEYKEIPNFSSRQDELIELAFIDESADYEVDMNGIYFDSKAPETERFVILSASGCS